MIEQYVLKRSVFEPRSQRRNQKKIGVHRTEKSSKKCLKWDISLKGTSFGGYRTISRSGDLGSFFWIAALRPWFEYASFEYKEAYFSDNLNFDL